MTGDLVEILEPRQLLSATVWFDEPEGILWVSGGADADHLDVRVDSAQQRPPGSFVTVTDPFALPEVVYEQWFAGTSLRTVQILGSGGDDEISTSLDAIGVTVGISGDEGNDVIELNTAAGANCGQVLGGEGDDIIRVVADFGAVGGYFIMGEDGDDVIFGSDVDDLIYGDFDDIREGSSPGGSDTIFGGRGDDVLFGGPRNDFIYGESGNDSLIGGDDADLLDGGKGIDVAEADWLDDLIDIELVISTSPEEI